MWELIYEDTFGFGEDRDPPMVECRGDNDAEGFFRLWNATLAESITGTHEKPVTGFARFTLLLIEPDGKRYYRSIDTDRYIHELAGIRKEFDRESIRKISARHYEYYSKGIEEKFWSSFGGQKPVMRIDALRPAKKLFVKKMFLIGALLVFANGMFIFCAVSFFHFFNSGEILSAVISAVFAMAFFVVNISFSALKEMYMRYTHPEMFFIEIDNRSFTFSAGSRIFKVPLQSITDISEQEILLRNGLHILYIIEYNENGKRKVRQFYRQRSVNDIIYNTTAGELKKYLVL